MERDRIVSAIKRREKRQPLDVVPVKVSQKNVGVDRRVRDFLYQALAQPAYSASGVKNETLARRRTDLDARRVPAEFEVLSLWRGRGSANTPEADVHPTVVLSEGHLSTHSFLVGLLGFELQRRGIGVTRFSGVVERLFDVADTFPDRGILVVQPRCRAQLFKASCTTR